MVKQKLATIIGGSGFVGRYVVQQLAKQGYRIRVAVRRPHLAGRLRLLGDVGQISLIQTNIRYEPSIAKAIEGADLVVNLPGLLFQSGKQKFNAIHHIGAQNVAEAVAAQPGTKLIHMSALGADRTSKSLYARTKALGEAAVKKYVPDAIILRPSLIFGPEDGFFNLFASMARLSPILPVIGGKSRFEPVYVGDVARAIVTLAETSRRPGIYELGGAETLTMKQMLQKMLEVTYRRNILIPVPFFAAKIKAFFLSILFIKLITTDQVELLKKDNIVSDEARISRKTLKGLNIVPARLDAILPDYLWRFRPRGQFDVAPNEVE